MSGEARRSCMASPCADPQQRQTPRQRRLRVRSGLTPLVSVQNTGKLSIHQVFSVQTSGQPRFLVTDKLTLDRFCEDWRIKLMCTSGPCPRSALEESSNGIGGHRPYRGHGPLVHNPCPGQWFYPSLFGSGSSGLGFAMVADGFLRQFAWLRQANRGSIGAKQTAKMTKKTPPTRKQAQSAA